MVSRKASQNIKVVSLQKQKTTWGSTSVSQDFRLHETLQVGKRYGVILSVFNFPGSVSPASTAALGKKWIANQFRSELTWCSRRWPETGGRLGARAPRWGRLCSTLDTTDAGSVCTANYIQTGTSPTHRQMHRQRERSLQIPKWLLSIIQNTDMMI